ncbi:hypothetical protein B0H16DRAFT_1612309 [Mycena metata]|uniref:Uncharacterized protein n=1 Tax=Mycena metata TaxID=1033252 RepID=A0AAD7MH08_9AGAR|nr:hypothetical protein B0H16DRAFT_1612309 [Mycena metata]
MTRTPENRKHINRQTKVSFSQRNPFDNSSTMFEPFENVTDFYEGLIVWCDPACYETDSSIPYDRRKSRELRPCLVVSVNSITRTFQAARLSATLPADPSHWVRIDSPPPITWKLNDAWIWVGPPPTITMIFNNAKVMHRELSPSECVAAVFRFWQPASKQGCIL